jgi:hypothetical protein
MSRWWVLLMGVFLACPGPFPAPSNDLEADGDDVAEDDGATDDDDPSPSIDLTDGAEVVLRFAQIIELRYLVHNNQLGLLAADDGCPITAGDAWTGGCTTADGYTFEGSLIASDLPGGGTHYVGDGWRVEGTGGPFHRIALDGTADVETTAKRAHYQIDGSMEAVSQPAVGALRDWTVTGSYTFEGIWPDGDVPQPHSFVASLRDPDGATWSADFLLLAVDGPCATYAEGTYVVLTSGDATAELDLPGDPDPCDYCWPWSLYGEPQPAPACLSL